MLDKETRFDNAIVFPGKILQYNYTLVNLTKEMVDTIELRNYIIPVATNNAKTNPDMKYQRDNKVIFKYYYKDMKGNYLFSFAVTPEQYKTDGAGI